MMPSAADLQYFIEIAATGNLSRAAERLGISQPSLSLAIRRLEDSIGVAVLIRTKRGVTLTQAGKQLLTHARYLLESWEALRSRAKDSHRQVTGSYLIGCHPSVALYSLPLFLPELMARFPELDINIRHDLSRKITESVVSMQLDMGIVVNPVRHPDLVLRKLCDDDVTFWTGSKRGPSREKSFEDPRTVVICDPDLLQTRDLLRRAKRQGMQVARTLTSSNLELVAELTAAGTGVGILPGRVAMRDKGLALKKLKDVPSYRDEIYVIYRYENRELRAVQHITEMVVKAFADGE